MPLSEAPIGFPSTFPQRDTPLLPARFRQHLIDQVTRLKAGQHRDPDPVRQEPARR
jgi:hypothetical protein